MFIDSRGALRRLVVAASMLHISLAFQSSAFLQNQRRWTSLSRASSLSRNAQTNKALSAEPDSKVGASDALVHDFFSASSSSDCDDANLPPSLSIIHRSIAQLESGSDIRGKFVDHPRRGSVAAVAKAIRNENSPALTPFAAHCLGFAFATMMLQNQQETSNEKDLVLCVGRDPRTHGVSVADAFSRGAESVEGVRVVYTGIASTPSIFDFCRKALCDGGVMITASHLPGDKNGIKFFTPRGGFEKPQIKTLISLAQQHSVVWYDQRAIPPTSGKDAVFCSEWVDWMPSYSSGLKEALVREVLGDNQDGGDPTKILSGLKLVLNSGNGSGGFFKSVLEDLGADTSACMHTEPDGNFPNGIPNPENPSMIEKTIQACEAANADLGILLDTDADRCGLVAPRTIGADGALSNYEAINRNRLIALMGVIFARQSPGCTIVTCSVTSEGLANFLQKDLGLRHVRHVKGYANVIHRARGLSESGEANAEVAIETSGHCALKENDYLDDGTYTAVKTVALLAREKAKDPNTSLLSLINGMKEMNEVAEIRMAPMDESLESTSLLYDFAALEVENACGVVPGWSLDTENLEGIRVSNGKEGSFFMLRKSLHDPVLSIQIEASSKESATATIVEPIIRMFESEPQIQSALDFSSLKDYAGDQ